MRRGYSISSAPQHVALLQDYYSRWECVIGDIEKEKLLDKLVYIQINPYNSTPTTTWIKDDLYEEESYIWDNEVVTVSDKVGEEVLVKQLIDAIEADCKSGNMNSRMIAEPTAGYISIQYGSLKEEITSIDLHYYENSENIIAFTKLLATADNS
jgi:hypothetical protein